MATPDPPIDLAASARDCQRTRDRLHAHLRVLQALTEPDNPPEERAAKVQAFQDGQRALYIADVGLENAKRCLQVRADFQEALDLGATGPEVDMFRAIHRDAAARCVGLLDEARQLLLDRIVQIRALLPPLRIRARTGICGRALVH